MKPLLLYIFSAVVKLIKNIRNDSDVFAIVLWFSLKLIGLLSLIFSDKWIFAIVVFGLWWIFFYIGIFRRASAKRRTKLKSLAVKIEKAIIAETIGSSNRYSQKKKSSKRRKNWEKMDLKPLSG